MPPKGFRHSVETKAKISAAGRLRHNPHSEETKQKLREARARQVHPRLAARGITFEMAEEAKGNGLRWCAGDCKAFLPSEKFYGRPPRAGHCAECTKKASYAVREKWSDEERALTRERLRKYNYSQRTAIRGRALFKKYGVTNEWYDEQLARQKGRCALCSATTDGVAPPAKSRPNEKRFLAVDHNHKTGKPRGLLCGECNRALHCVEIKEGWATRAVNYLAIYA